MPHSHSDHCPLLITLVAEGDGGQVSRPFRFHASWMLHREFHSLVEREWQGEVQLCLALKNLKLKLEDWNQNTFGNIFRRKRRNEARLAGVQKLLAQRVTEGLLKLEQKLCMERREILLQEELLWKQKSRNDWLKAGDDNTKFFHTSTIVRRRRNTVESLKNEAGVWVEEKNELKELVLSFYKGLFSSDPNAKGEFLRGLSVLG